MAIGTATAILGGAALGLGGAAYSANKASSANQQATQANVNAANQSADIQRDQLNYIKQINAPYQQIGTQALNTLGSQFGFNPYQQPQAVQQPMNFMSRQSQSTNAADYGYEFPNIVDAGDGTFRVGNQPQMLAQSSPVTQTNVSATGTPNYSAFFADPGYQFRQEQGQRAINNSLLAQGLGLSGSQLRASMDYNQGLASQEYGNWYNRLASLAGIGQNANQNAAAGGANAAAGISNAYTNMGIANAQGAQNAGNIYGNLAQNVTGIAGGTLGNYNYAKQMGWL